MTLSPETFLVIVIGFVTLSIIAALYGLREAVKAFSKKSPPKSKEAKEQEMIRTLQRVMTRRGELADWAQSGPDDISIGLTYRSSDAITKTELAGIIDSTDGRPLIAIDRTTEMMGGNTIMAAASTEFFILYERSHGVVEIRFNEEVLGRIDLADNIFDSNRQLIGHAKRNSSNGFVNAGDVHTMGEVNYLFNMAGRDLALVFVPPNKALSTHEGPAPDRGNAVLQVLDTPSPEEEKWLIAIAIWEVAYYGYATAIPSPVHLPRVAPKYIQNWVSK